MTSEIGDLEIQLTTKEANKMNTVVVYLAELPETLASEVASYVLSNCNPKLDLSESEEQQLGCVIKWNTDEYGDTALSVWCGRGSDVFSGVYLPYELEKRVWECFCMSSDLYNRAVNYQEVEV